MAIAVGVADGDFVKQRSGWYSGMHSQGECVSLLMGKEQKKDNAEAQSTQRFAEK